MEPRGSPMTIATCGRLPSLSLGRFIKMDRYDKRPGSMDKTPPFV
jgi:hypothetical protein